MAGAATAMILAAGRGERMRPLTDTCPKPLLALRGKPLIAHQIEALARAGHRDIAINAAHLAERLVDAIGDGAAFGVRIHWSREPEPLETAGGIATAFPLLAPGPVLIVSGDIWTGYDYASLAPTTAAMRGSPDGPRVHLVMVPNPPYHPRGDFALLPPEQADASAALHPPGPNSGRIVALPAATLPSAAGPSATALPGVPPYGTTQADSPGPRGASGVVEPGAGPGGPPPNRHHAGPASPPPNGHRAGPGSPPPVAYRAGPPGPPPAVERVSDAPVDPVPLTFGNIGVYDSALFAELPRGTKLKLLPLFQKWIAAGIVSGERFDGPWANVGTPDDLARLDAALADPA
jgi:MurNAc alpha-1-phosphate uridylyltransferase